MAVFQFVIDDKIEEPMIEFISEDPYLQYVSGRSDKIKIIWRDCDITVNNNSRPIP